MAKGIDNRDPRSGALIGPQIELTPEEIPLLADYIMGKLESMEKDHPYLLEDEEYKDVKNRLRDEGITPTENTGFILGTLYVDLILCLKRIGESNQNVVSFRPSKKEVRKIPEGYFPVTFDDLKNDFSQAIQPEHIENALTAAAESIIMGELEGGIQRVIPRYCESVKTEIIEVLSRSSGEEDDATGSVISKFGIDNLLTSLFQDDESLALLALHSSSVDHQSENLTVRIVEIILRTREEIRNEYEGTAKKAKITRDDIEALKQTGWTAVIAAANKMRKPKAPTTGREQRLELALRICFTETRFRLMSTLRVV